MSTSANSSLAITALRALSLDAIEAANSGHPGMPLGAAALAWSLWGERLKHNPANPNWVDRDRFILSAGHASALLYSLLYLFNYGLTAADLKQFRQFDSKTPGHPEYKHTVGVEMTTGPLGQGLASAVGFALAENHLAAKFNRANYTIVDHNTYVLAGDGCLMEGVSAEAASLAGTLALGKLIVFYDSNKITIEGSTELSFKEDVAQRYRAYGWQVLEVPDANDVPALIAAIDTAKLCSDKPSLIIVHSKIGYASPLEGSAKTHGSPLGAEKVAQTKAALHWPADLKAFEIPRALQDFMQTKCSALAQTEKQWEDLFAAWSKAYPDLAQEWQQYHAPAALQELTDDESFWAAPSKAEATRVSSARCLNALAAKLPNLLGGSADLGPSNNSVMEGLPYYSPAEPLGRNIHYGVREFAMACCMNGMLLHGGLLSYCATFFVFSDYLKAALRLSALMQLPALYILTHDSIGVGEDGPTHEPIEQLATLRSIPGLLTFRPCDYKECAAAWLYALQSQRPSAFILSRQALPQIPESGKALAQGAYIVRQKGDLELILLASGSEVALALAAQEQLWASGIGSRVVSVPCMELFWEQSAAYQEEVLPQSCRQRIAVEAAATMPWYRFVGTEGKVLGLDHFGASGPAERLFSEFGFTVEHLVELAHELLGK